MYSPNHTEDECDKCLANVGKQNLIKVPFLLCMKNDKCPHHYVDTSKKYETYMINGKWKAFQLDAFPYKQYRVCRICNEVENKLNKRI